MRFQSVCFEITNVRCWPPTLSAHLLSSLGWRQAKKKEAEEAAAAAKAKAKAAAEEVPYHSYLARPPPPVKDRLHEDTKRYVYVKEKGGFLTLTRTHC